MAIYHLTCKPVCRASGRSATAAAAYRAGKCGKPILDQRTGRIHDFTRKVGVESADLVLPDGAPTWATDRSALWNAAELSERRKDACVAREFEVALPSELTNEQRRQLTFEFVKDMVGRERCAVDVAIHLPSRHGDKRNHHAHILRTTREVTENGMGAKLDTEKAGRRRRADLKEVRQRWATMANAALAAAGVDQTIDPRSLKDQGIDRAPTFHKGVTATAIERNYISEDPVTEVFQRFADFVASSAAEVEVWKIAANCGSIAADLLQAEQALAEAASLEEKRDGVRTAALGRINSYGTATDRNLRAASQNARNPQRDPARIAEACATFNAVKRDRWFAQGFAEQAGQLARSFVIKVSSVVERVMSRISGIVSSKGGEATRSDMVVETSPFAPSAAPILPSYRENARAKSLRIYSLATQQVVTDKGLTPEQELVNLKVSLDQRGMKVTIAIEGGQFVGPVEVIGQHYLVQNLGIDQRVIHELAALPTGLTSGDTLDALYDLNPDGSVRTPVVVVNGENKTDDSGDNPAGPEAPGSRGKFRP